MSGLQAITPVQSISEVVYDKLKAAVLEGVFSKGERLVENEIATKLKVSRTPVRSALLRLESEGILENVGNHGLVVKEYTLSDIKEIYLIREALESLAAECAALNATDSDMEEIKEILGEMSQVNMDPEVDSAIVFDVNRRFSEAFNRASHMPALVRMIESLKEQMIRFRRVTLKREDRRETALEEHRGMFEAIIQKNPALSAERTRNHVRNALNTYFISVEETK
jgi:DNA-binding GntR family transcriptional regulator